MKIIIKIQNENTEMKKLIFHFLCVNEPGK